MAVIAQKCPEHRVVVVDIDAERIAAWQSDRLPIYEPGLDEVVRAVRDRNLFFSTEIDRHIAEANIIFVSVNTPTKGFGQGAGKAADLQYWERTARQILRNSHGPKIIVEKSTLPVRTAEAMEQILRSTGDGPQFDIVSNPEFLAEGSAIRDLEHPDRVLVGARGTPSGQRAMQAVVDIYAHWVAPERIITTNLWSAELSKLVANALLAERISSINAVSALCEKTGADVAEVARAVGLDRRIGPQFLKASVGYGGSCFKKDILNLVYLCQHYGLSDAADYWGRVVTMNEHQEARFVSTMVSAMFNTVAGKRIALVRRRVQGRHRRHPRVGRAGRVPGPAGGACRGGAQRSSRLGQRPGRPGLRGGSGDLRARPIRRRLWGLRHRDPHRVAVLCRARLSQDIPGDGQAGIPLRRPEHPGSSSASTRSGSTSIRSASRRWCISQRRSRGLSCLHPSSRRPASTVGRTCPIGSVTKTATASTCASRASGAGSAGRWSSRASGISPRR